MSERTREETIGEQPREEDATVERGRFGLDLFSEATPPAARRRYLLHAAVYAVSLLLVIWPVLPLFNRVEPYVLGMPFVMFWSALSLVVVLVNTVALFRFEHGPLTKPTR